MGEPGIGSAPVAAKTTESRSRRTRKSLDDVDGRQTRNVRVGPSGRRLTAPGRAEKAEQNRHLLFM